MRNRKKIHNHIDYHNSFEFSTFNNKSLNGWYTTKVRNIYIIYMYVCMYLCIYWLLLSTIGRKSLTNAGRGQI